MKRTIDKKSLIVVMISMLMTAAVFLPIIGMETTQSYTPQEDTTGSCQLMEMNEDGSETIRFVDYFNEGWISMDVTAPREIAYEQGSKELKLIPADNWFGNAEVTLTATYNMDIIDPPRDDSIKSSGGDTIQSTIEDTVQFSVKVLAVNDPPEPASNLDYRLKTTTDSYFSLPEDYDLDLLFNDVDSDLTYSWESWYGLSSVGISDSIVETVRTFSETGEDVIEITATDGEYTCTKNLYLSLYSKEYISFAEDGRAEEALDRVYDPATQNCKVINSTHIKSNLEDTRMTCLPDKDWFGTENMGVYVTPKTAGSNPPGDDSIMSAPGDSTSPPEPECIEFGYYQLGVSVTPVNDRPVALSNDVYLINMTEDSTYAFGDGYAVDLNYLFDDVDSELTYSWVSENGMAFPVIHKSSMYAITSYQNDNTVYDRITIMASDGEYVSEYDFYVRVQPKETISMQEDVDLTFDLSHYVDASEELFYMTNSDNIMSFEHVTMDSVGRTTLRSTENWFGDETLALYTEPLYDYVAPSNQIFSAPGESVNPPETEYIEYGYYEFNVDVGPVNDAPTASELPSLSVEEDDVLASVLDLDDYFSDIDSTLMYSVDGGSKVAAQLDSDALLDLTPAENWFGTETLTITANDGQDTVSRDLTVVVTPLNDPPSALGHMDSADIEEDSALDMDLSGYFADVDDSVTYSYIADGNFTVELNETAGLANITPAADWNGQGTVTFYASDSEYSVSQELEIKVSPVNDPPLPLEAPDSVGFVEDGGATVELGALFSDIDSTLTYAVSIDNPEIRGGLATESGLLTLSAGKDWSGTGSMTLTASDGEYSASHVVELRVDAVNDAPKLLPAAAELSFDEDTEYEIELGELFSDVDSSLTFAVDSDIRLDVEVDEAEGIARITPEENWYGRGDLTITASDGEYEISRNFECQINPVNDAPVRNKDLPQVVMEGQSYILDLNPYYSDIEGDRLVFSFGSSENLIITETDSAGVFKISAPEGWRGAETLKVTVSDGTDTYQMPISIASVQAAQSTDSSSATGGGTEGIMMIALAVCAVGMVAVTATARRKIRSRENVRMEGA